MSARTVVGSPEEAARADFERDRLEREALLTELRQDLKAKRLTYAAIGRSAGKSASWIGLVMRGGYPYYGGCYLPKGIADVLDWSGCSVPDKIRTRPRAGHETDDDRLRGYP